MTEVTPHGWHSLTPRLFVANPGALVQFLVAAFGAVGTVVAGRPAELRIGDSVLMVVGVGPRAATASAFYLYVADADAIYRRALEAGGTSIETPFDTPYGDRRAMIADPAGNTWQIASRPHAPP
ncbi:MAG: VOC family protein [Dehalococcoidia bacterium]|nr:VOC family protein [Dehalococcoidia bacterium]